MGGIHGGAESLIVGVDEQIAVLAEHVGLLPRAIRTPAFACAAKPQAEESGAELKWLMPNSGGLIWAESAPWMETRAAPIPPPT